MSGPAVGQWLMASCSAQSYGRILAVRKDANGLDTIDIEVSDPNDLIIKIDQDPGFEQGSLTTLEVPDGVKLILRGVQYLMNGDRITCNTPGDGCFRCVKFFSLTDKDESL